MEAYAGANDSLLIPKPKRVWEGHLFAFLIMALFAHALIYAFVLRYGKAFLPKKSSLISVHLIKELPPPAKPKLKPPPLPKLKPRVAESHSKAVAPLLHVEQVKFHQKPAEDKTAESKSNLAQIDEPKGGTKIGNPEGTPEGKGPIENTEKVKIPPPISHPRLVLPDRKDPAVLARCQPPYPDSERDQGIEGTVVLVVTVGKRGEVLGVQVAQSSGNSALDEAAVQNVRQCWRFAPAVQNGAAADSRITFPVVFRLQ